MRLLRFCLTCLSTLSVLNLGIGGAYAQQTSIAGPDTASPLVAVFAIAFISATAVALVLTVRLRRIAAENEDLKTEVGLRDATHGFGRNRQFCGLLMGKENQSPPGLPQH